MTTETKRPPTEREKRKAAEAAVRANSTKATDLPLEQKSDMELHAILAAISKHRADGEALEQGIRVILTKRREGR